MRCTGFLLLVLLSVGTTNSVRAQNVLEVSAKAIQQHFDHQTFPVYPPIAKAAHVQGTVVLDLRIGATGKIESMKVVSGPPMLQQAAIDCVKQWTFRPFEKEGSPVAAHGQYSIIFTLGGDSGPADELTAEANAPNQGAQKTPSQTITVNVRSETPIQGADAKVEQDFHAADDACKQGISSKEFNDATVSSCREAAVLAGELPTEGNYIAKRSAFVYAATAYGNVGRFQEALSWAVKAVEVVKLGHDSDSGKNAAYSTKGEIEALLGDYAASEQDLSQAEEPIRQKIVQEGKDTLQSTDPYLVKTLVRDLTLHAKVLQQLNRPDEAQKKLDEAAQLTK